MRDLKRGDLLIEHAVYRVENVGANEVGVSMVQKQGNKWVTLPEQVAIQNRYADEFLLDGVNYDKTVEVGKEDKKDGTLGIRSIFENTPPYMPFSVLFTKQDTVLSNKAYKLKQEEQLNQALEYIERAKSSKKSISDAAFKALKEVQENPVVPIVPGEDRVLVGYKLTSETRDGRYDCVDFNLLEMRPVNINTIKEYITGGVRYIVK